MRRAQRQLVTRPRLPSARTSSTTMGRLDLPPESRCTSSVAHGETCVRLPDVWLTMVGMRATAKTLHGKGLSSMHAALTVFNSPDVDGSTACRMSHSSLSWPCA
jgi:hypothetical protein